MITKRLERIDSFFDVVANHLQFSLINPKNTSKMRKQFLSSNKNPLFKYDKASSSLVGFKDMLLEISFGDSPLEKIFEHKRKELILKIDVLLAIGQPKFADKIKKLYPPPSEKLVEQAYKLLKLSPSPSGKKILRKEALKMFRKTFSLLQIKYRLHSVDMTTSARVDASSRILELRKRERFAEDYVKRLIVHEIGTHALRTENGMLQKLRIYKNGFAHYLDTEEGLSSFNEFRAGVMTNSILRNYAGRVVAIHFALSHDFAATYKHLCSFFSSKMAWKLALRAKRGLGDTSKKGAYTKDCVYLKGFLDVRKFAKKHSIDELYVGKVGIKDLPLLGETESLQKPKYLFDTLLVNDFITPSDRRISEEELDKLLE